MVERSFEWNVGSVIISNNNIGNIYSNSIRGGEGGVFQKVFIHPPPPTPVLLNAALDLLALPICLEYVAQRCSLVCLPDLHLLLSHVS